MNADSNKFKRGWPWICAPAAALLTHDRTLIHLHWTLVLAWSCMYVSAAGRTRGYVELMHLDYSSENNKKIRGQASLGKKVISKISPIWIINSRQTFHFQRSWTSWTSLTPKPIVGFDPDLVNLNKVRFHYNLKKVPTLMALSHCIKPVYYINSHCYKFATSHKRIASILPTYSGVFHKEFVESCYSNRMVSTNVE